MSERFVIRELTGFPSGRGINRATTDVYVLDTWYAWEVVAAFLPKADSHMGLAQRRLSAEARARKLNQDHRAWERNAA